MSNIKKKILMVDVDDTVVASVREWVEWYKELTGQDLVNSLRDETGKTNNLLDLMHKHRDPMEFWRQPYLYQDMKPRAGSVETLRELSEHFDIVFVSASMPEHTHSKEMFLTKYFDFHKGFVSTSTKQFVKADYFIDDFKDYLRQVQEHQPNCKCIQIKTKLSNEGEFPLLTWGEIRYFMMREVKDMKADNAKNN